MVHNVAKIVKKIRFAMKWLAIAFIVFCVLSMISTIAIFHAFFGRNELKFDDISPRYADINQEMYPRVQADFLANGNRLRGYIYGKSNKGGLRACPETPYGDIIRTQSA